MFQPRLPLFFLAAIITGAACATASAAVVDPALAAAIASPARPPAAVARDKARHPAEELTFFGLGPKMNVVELWPGGGYWTDILGPYLAPGGHYTCMHRLPEKMGRRLGHDGDARLPRAAVAARYQQPTDDRSEPAAIPEQANPPGWFRLPAYR